MDPLANYSDENAQPIDTSTGPPLPLHLPGQNIALINVAHRGLSIHSEHAAFRILGFFETAEEAVAHFRSQRLEDTETGIHKAHSWKLVASKPSTSPEKEMGRVDEILTANRARIEADKKEFESRKAGETTKETVPSPPSSTPPPSSPPPAGASAPQGVGSVLPDQRFAAVGVVLGDADDSVVCFFGAFPNETEARRYVRDTLSEEYDEFEIFVVAMYRFVFLKDAFEVDNAENGFRHKYLDDVWAQRRADHLSASKFKKKYSKETKKELIFTPLPPAGVEVSEGK